MKIEVKDYDAAWAQSFNAIKNELSIVLSDFNPKIQHIGSTAVPGIAAKPIIEIAVGLKSVELLDEVIAPMINNHYIYYEVFNSSMPQRRLFVGLKEKKDILRFKSVYTKQDTIPHEAIHPCRLTHIHVWEHGSSEWNRHIAFREYLIEHPTIRDAYESLKKSLSKLQWKDGMEYNEGKNEFIKKEEVRAVSWYKNKSINRM
jgi:GrpB-like predicted nucleotidyltransferase (UPF0157 family)